MKLAQIIIPMPIPILEGSSEPVPTWATVVAIAICVIAALLLLFVIGYAIYDFVIEPKKHRKKATIYSEYTYHRQNTLDVQRLTEMREKYKDEERKFCAMLEEDIKAHVESLRKRGYTDEQINEMYNQAISRMFYGHSPF